MLPENGALYLTANQIYFGKLFYCKIFFHFISHMRWVQLYKDYLQHEYQKHM